MVRNNAQTTNTIPGDSVAEMITNALKNLRYGSVEIVVHDGRIVQIERKQKWRMNLENSPNPDVGL
jgi:hypothetical protein